MVSLFFWQRRRSHKLWLKSEIRGFWRLKAEPVSSSQIGRSTERSPLCHHSVLFRSLQRPTLMVHQGVFCSMIKSEMQPSLCSGFPFHGPHSLSTHAGRMPFCSVLSAANVLNTCFQLHYAIWRKLFLQSYNWSSLHEDREAESRRPKEKPEILHTCTLSSTSSTPNSNPGQHHGQRLCPLTQLKTRTKYMTANRSVRTSLYHYNAPTLLTGFGTFRV